MPLCPERSAREVKAPRAEKLSTHPICLIGADAGHVAIASAVCARAASLTDSTIFGRPVGLPDWPLRKLVLVRRCGMQLPVFCLFSAVYTPFLNAV